MTQEENNLIVKKGMAIGFSVTIMLYVLVFLLMPQFQQELALAERIKLGFECLLLPGLVFLIMILCVGAQRFGNAAENPILAEANTERLKVDLRVLSNTHEQLVIYIINSMGLAVLLPFNYLSLLPIYAVLFVVGRFVFWYMYHKHILWRAPGFAMAVLPAVSGIAYSCVAVLLNLFA